MERLIRLRVELLFSRSISSFLCRPVTYDNKVDLWSCKTDYALSNNAIATGFDQVLSIVY